ncbi:hypothetical protein HQ584_11865 [Patescibacteria group bacterium]|nr:hypothetical protein [Patescibacteria group bacterium]
MLKIRKEFLRHIKEELTRRNPEDIEKRVEIARKNTWENRLREIENIIFGRMQKR